MGLQPLPLGIGGGNPFDQDLNTTDNVTFNNLNLTGTFNASKEGRSVFLNPDGGNRAVVDLFSNASLNEITFSVGDDAITRLALIGGAGDHSLLTEVDNTGAKTSLDAGVMELEAPSIDLDSAVIMMSSLPVVDPGVPGQLWNDTGTVKVSL